MRMTKRPDNGPLRVIPGSHRVSEPPIAKLAFGSGMGRHPQEVKIVAPAGSLIMFNSADLWHSGTFNCGPRPIGHGRTRRRPIGLPGVPPRSWATIHPWHLLLW